MKNASTDHRTRVTKLLIRQAFIKLLSQKPIQNISIKELCKEAEINRGTFYTHYNDIYDMLNQIEDELQEDFEKALEPLNHMDGKAFTSEIKTTQVFQYIKESPELYPLTLGDYGDKFFMLKLINIGREKFIKNYSKYFKDVPPEKVEYFFTFASSGCMGLLQKWFADGMIIPVEEIAKVAEDIILMGIQFLK